MVGLRNIQPNVSHCRELSLCHWTKFTPPKIKSEDLYGTFHEAPLKIALWVLLAPMVMGLHMSCWNSACQVFCLATRHVQVSEAGATLLGTLAALSRLPLSSPLHQLLFQCMIPQIVLFPLLALLRYLSLYPMHKS